MVKHEGSFENREMCTVCAYLMSHGFSGPSDIAGPYMYHFLHITSIQGRVNFKVNVAGL
jgi:hypothetical protein